MISNFDLSLIINTRKYKLFLRLVVHPYVRARVQLNAASNTVIYLHDTIYRSARI